VGRLRATVAALLLLSVVTAGIIGARRPARHEKGARLSAATRATVPTTDADPSPTTGASAPPQVTTTAKPAPPAPPPRLASGTPRVVVSANGVVLPVLAVDSSTFRVRTPCGAEMTVGRATVTPVAHATVVLDAGHGGGEAGAVGSNGLAEKTVNLAVVEVTSAVLQRAGFGVVLTRGGDYRMTLASRADVVNSLRPRAFVSVHPNAEPDGPFPRPGTETYYQIASPDSKRLAGLVYEEVERALSQYQVDWVADTDAGAKYRPGQGGDDYYAVLRRTHGTASALAELAYISDPPEAALLSRADVQQVEGQAVARGIIRYLTTDDPGSGYTVPYPRTEPAGGGGGPEGCTDPPM